MRIKLQIAFVNQTLLPDDVGVAVVVEMAVGGQAVAVATVAVRRADKAFLADPRQPDAARLRIGVAVGQAFQTTFFLAVTRYGVVARFAVQPFRVQHEVFAQSDVDAAGREFFQIAAAQTQPQFARYAVFRHFFGDFSVGNIHQPRHIARAVQQRYRPA